MITDWRKLNSAWVQPPKFKTENQQTKRESLSLNLHLTLGAVVDLSNFFFHLGVHPSAGRWIRIKTEMGDFQWTTLPTFGLHCPPFWTGRLAQVVEKTLRHQGVHLMWCVDDILILGRQSAICFNEPRESSSDMQRSRIDCQQKEIGGLPRSTDQSEDQDGGPQPGKLSRGL